MFLTQVFPNQRVMNARENFLLEIPNMFRNSDVIEEFRLIMMRHLTEIPYK